MIDGAWKSSRMDRTDRFVVVISLFSPMFRIVDASNDKRTDRIGSNGSARARLDHIADRIAMPRIIRQ